MKSFSQRKIFFWAADIFRFLSSPTKSINIMIHNLFYRWNMKPVEVETEQESKKKKRYLCIDRSTTAY